MTADIKNMPLVPGMPKDTMDLVLGTPSYKTTPEGGSTFEWDFETTLTLTDELRLRDTYTKNYGYVLLTAEVIKTLSSFLTGKKVIEIAAGTGALGGLLRQNGVDIKLTDKHQPDTNGPYGFNCHTPMDEVVDIENVNLEGFDVVIFTWGTYLCKSAETLLNRMLPGQILIHNGETMGCTETDRFWHMIDNRMFDRDTDMTNILNEDHRTFSWIHDSWRVLRKKPNQQLGYTPS